MIVQRIEISLWLRFAAITALVFAVSVVLVSVIILWSFSGVLEWALFAASLGGAVGSTQYRTALAVPALSRHCGIVWFLSATWGTAFLLAALKAGEPFPADHMSFLARLGAMSGLSAGMSLICFIPLKWLQTVGAPRAAP